jgi:Multicopper oxidase
MLGTIDAATDQDGNPLYYPDTEAYRKAGLAGKPLHGTLTWNSPLTEHIRLGDTEEWEIWNLTPDAHPIHLHLVSMELKTRQIVNFQGMQQAFLDEAAEEGIAVGPVSIIKDGTDLKSVPMLMHDGKSMGVGYQAVSPNTGPTLTLFEKDNVMYGDYFQRLDTITALPGQVTTIRATFDKPGRYVWHCHVLAHEDHQMMRVFHVGDLPTAAPSSSSAAPSSSELSEENVSTMEQIHTQNKESDEYDDDEIDVVKEHEPPFSFWKRLSVVIVGLCCSTTCSLWVLYRLLYDVNPVRVIAITTTTTKMRYDSVPSKEESVVTSSESSSSISSSCEDEDEISCYRDEPTDSDDDDDVIEEGRRIVSH